jgi:hypothetical protein
LAPSVRDKEDALAAAGLAVLQAVPGYTIATDMANATLLVLPPRNATLQMVQATPASAVALAPPVAIGNFGYQSIGVTSTGFPIATHGRVAITLTFSDGSSTVASYHVLPPLDELVGAYGRFVTDAVNGAWYANMSDPFGRAPCVLGYNRDLKKQIGYHGGGGYEDHRIFNNGLSDEAGAGANVGFAAKVSGQPTVEEVAKLDAYVTQTLYGVKPGLPFGASLQCVEGAESLENPSCGPKDIVGPTADGIMSSMFWVPTNLTTQPKMPGYYAATGRAPSMQVLITAPSPRTGTTTTGAGFAIRKAPPRARRAGQDGAGTKDVPHRSDVRTTTLISPRSISRCISRWRIMTCSRRRTSHAGT